MRDFFTRAYRNTTLTGADLGVKLQSYISAMDMAMDSEDCGLGVVLSISERPELRQASIDDVVRLRDMTIQ